MRNPAENEPWNALAFTPENEAKMAQLLDADILKQCGFTINKDSRFLTKEEIFASADGFKIIHKKLSASL